MVSDSTKKERNGTKRHKKSKKFPRTKVCNKVSYYPTSKVLGYKWPESKKWWENLQVTDCQISKDMYIGAFCFVVQKLSRVPKEHPCPDTVLQLTLPDVVESDSSCEGWLPVEHLGGLSPPAEGASVLFHCAVWWARPFLCNWSKWSIIRMTGPYHKQCISH